LREITKYGKRLSMVGQHLDLQFFFLKIESVVVAKKILK
jgi:hypothetical protein